LGPPNSLDDLFNVSYRELCRLAACIRRSDAHATISTATLVHETWIRLSSAEGLESTTRLHLKHIVARAMRQYVIQAARRRRALKRGGMEIFVTLDESMDFPVSSDQELLALDDTLAELAHTNRRQADLIELRFFAGLDVAEAAEALGVAEVTAQRDWRAAKAWLAAQTRRGNEPGVDARE
jgi:RNA polymerase sigma factor (TIGR02999 family)